MVTTPLNKTRKYKYPLNKGSASNIPLWRLDYKWIQVANSQVKHRRKMRSNVWSTSNSINICMKNFSICPGNICSEGIYRIYWQDAVCELHNTSKKGYVQKLSNNWHSKWAGVKLYMENAEIIEEANNHWKLHS